MTANVMGGLLISFVFYVLFLTACGLVVAFLPASLLGPPAKAFLVWLPPFLGGDALRNWAAAKAEDMTRARLAGKRTGKTASQLAAELEEGAMQAMLPTAGPEELKRVVACPDVGQGTVGVTAPEALAIAAYMRKNLSRAEQEQIQALAEENAKKIAAGMPVDSDLPALPCALQGKDHVCCVYEARPLRCRIQHAISVARELTGSHEPPPTGTEAGRIDPGGHEQTVAEGIEIGVTRALRSAGLSADVYELNGALATALGMPDAAERWAKGEKVFHSPLVWRPSSPHSPVTSTSAAS